MSINFAHEYINFEKEQERKREEYLAAGMQEDQIEEILKFDRYQFNRDLAYYRHTQPLITHDEKDEEASDMGNALMKNFLPVLSYEMQVDKTSDLWWINDIENVELYKAIKKMSDEHKRIIDLLAFKQMNQKEIALIMGTSPAAISQRIATIKKNLKKFNKNLNF